MPRTLAFLSCAVAFIAGSVSSLGAVQGIVNREIKCHGDLLATINFDVPTTYINGATGGITVNGNATKTANFAGEIRWLQMIKTNQPLNTNTPAGTPYFDPGELDPTGNDFPFYWNENLKGRDGNNYPNLWVQNKFSNGGNTLSFFDQPKRTWTGAAIDWTAELSLVCWNKLTDQIGVLWTGSYGFNITAGGVISINGITELAAGGTFLTQAAIDQRFGDIYTISTDCETCNIPAPGVSTLAFVGIVAMGRRRRS
ncbi:MAG: hypothetical protein JNM86_00400 [Phycisphaerae bacterium]|nr:hypothetical protein [Phycisphaerae bacterium]MBN8598526.1 hypothetical protein [Planctomycetota bacterium]